MQHAALIKPKSTTATPTRGVVIFKSSCLLLRESFTRPGVVRHSRSAQWLQQKNNTSQFVVSSLADDDDDDDDRDSSKNLSSPENTNSDFSDPPTPAYDPRSYSKGSTTIAIPVGLRSAGAVFVLAGFLKILILCFPYSSMAISMFIQGKADLGTWAALKMIPIALGVLSLAKVLVDRKIHERKYFHRLVVVASVLALLTSRWLFARTRPSPLDPLIAAHQKEVISSVTAARKQQEARAMAQQQGRYLEPSQQAKQEVERRPRGRF